MFFVIAFLYLLAIATVVNVRRSRTMPAVAT
jgi:hypothetical protein